MKLTKRSELKKHVGVVEISNPLSLMQRKAFSLLLFNAYEEIKEAKGKIHTMSMSELCRLLGYKSNDWDSLDKEIDKLQSTRILWYKNEKAFGRVNFFSYTGRNEKTDLFEYSFHPKLEKLLYKPDIYAQINVLALRQFESKYTISLYENLSRYRPNKLKGFSGGSPKWSVEEFRVLMGVSESDLYSQFKFLNAKIINPAVKEINAVSDLMVSVEKIKSGRKITALKFHIKDNLQPSLPLIPAPETVESQVNHPLVKKMVEVYSVPPMQAGEWLLQYGEDRFKQVLELINESILANDIKSPIAWIRKAFEENYSNVTGNSVKEKILAQKKEEERKRKKEKSKIAQEKKKEKREKEQTEERKITEYLDSLPSDEKTELFNKFYDEHNDLLTKGLPINRGDDPSISNEQVRMWWREFLRESHTM